MKQLLIATHNPAKRQELVNGFSSLTSLGAQIVSLHDLGIYDDVEENGSTFKENALIKARFFSRKTNLPTVADDGGILIDALNGEPGVKSKRWLGYDATDKELVEYTLKRLSLIPMHRRTAHFAIVLTYINPLTNTTIQSTAHLEGRIATHVGPEAQEGFPYRSLFIVSKYNKYYDELTPTEHTEINHRIQAVKKLIPKIKQDFLS